MASIVIDTSAILAVLLNEPERPALIRVTAGVDLTGAPSLPWEVGNALVAAVRRTRLSAADVRSAWASYQEVPIRLPRIDAQRALTLSLDAGLYAYDGYVLEAARSGRLPLLTLDRRLARAAGRLGVRLMEFES
jgi:predicted nucleic acid-binding protein